MLDGLLRQFCTAESATAGERGSPCVAQDFEVCALLIELDSWFWRPWSVLVEAREIALRYEKNDELSSASCTSE
jgi:hypothetical protein